MTSHQEAALVIRTGPRWTGPVPAHPSSAAGTGPAARGVHAAEGVPGAERPRRILVVDDEPNICSFIGRALAAAGYLIGFAGSGSEGLRHALAERFGVTTSPPVGGSANISVQLNGTRDHLDELRSVATLNALDPVRTSWPGER